MTFIDTIEIKKAIHTGAMSMTTCKKVYYSQAVQNTSFPYIAFFIITDIYNGEDTGSKYKDIKIQFNAYSNKNDNGDEVDTILNEIETLMKNISGTNLIVIDVSRDFITPAQYIEKVWRGVVQFNLHILSQ